MATHIQLVMYEGFLGADPEMRYIPSGKAVTNFRIGSTRRYKTADGNEVSDTTWLKVTAWGALGEIVNKYCDKGSHVIVTGRLRGGENGSPNVYETKNGGHGASFEIEAKEVRIIKGKSGSKESSAEEDMPY